MPVVFCLCIIFLLLCPHTDHDPLAGHHRRLSRVCKSQEAHVPHPATRCVLWAGGYSGTNPGTSGTWSEPLVSLPGAQRHPWPCGRGERKGTFRGANPGMPQSLGGWGWGAAASMVCGWGWSREYPDAPKPPAGLGQLLSTTAKHLGLEKNLPRGEGGGRGRDCGMATVSGS